MATNPNEVADPLSGINIPPKPQILVDIQMAGDDPDEIIALIQKDIGVSAGVLKSINSPFYNLRSPVTSIEKAVMMLGLSTVISLVDNLALRNSLSNDQQISMEAYWDSSLDVARAASAIAEKTRVLPKETAYTLGLFHNCGIPILLQKFPNIMDISHKAYSDPEGNIVTVERAAMKLDHAYVGYRLCQLWCLDDDLCQAILHHHDGKANYTNGTLGDQSKIMVALLVLAEHIAEVHRTLGAQNSDYAWKNCAAPVLDVLNLSDDDYQNLKEDIVEIIFSK